MSEPGGFRRYREGLRSGDDMGTTPDHRIFYTARPARDDQRALPTRASLNGATIACAIRQRVASCD